MEDESELLARSAEIGEETVVGAGTSVGDDSKIVGSVIGRRCKIGRNVMIKDSILCDDVEVEDNSVVVKSMLCDHVKIGADSELPSGCVISFGVDVRIYTFTHSLTHPKIKTHTLSNPGTERLTSHTKRTIDINGYGQDGRRIQ